MGGNWLGTIKTYIHCTYEILLPLWFSMKFGAINSYLVVCFTMVKKISKLENIYKILKKMSHNGYKTTFMEKCVTFTINIRENFTNYFSHHSID